MMQAGGDAVSTTKNSRKPVRVYFDGCFDCLHLGHVNALRQAKAMGDVLVVGIHSDVDITRNKGRSPVCPESERYALIRAIRWVDEVVEGSTYLPDVEMLEKYNCDFCVHGDDNSIDADGKDAYRLLKAAGRYRECKRTRGISTTDIIKRIVALTSDQAPEDAAVAIDSCQFNGNSYQVPCSMISAFDAKGLGFLPTSSFIASFASGVEPKPNDRVVYVAGDFDLYHTGYLEFLEKARKEGDYLLVGIHSDDVVRSYRGASFPVMSLLERALNILGCKHVSEIVVGASLTVTSQMIDVFRIDVVCHGSTMLPQSIPQSSVYADPMSREKFKLLDIGSNVSTVAIVDRIRNKRSEYNRGVTVKHFAMQSVTEFHSGDAFSMALMTAADCISVDS